MLDPSDSTVQLDNDAKAPSGCSRYKGAWYFKSNEEGGLDGESQPVCKASSGTTTCVYLHDIKKYAFAKNI